MKTGLVLALLWLGLSPVFSEGPPLPVDYAIFGLAHDHANGFIPRARDRRELRLVGIVETNAELASYYARLFNLPTNLFCPNLDALLAKTHVQAVVTFTSPFEHRHIVELCAARRLHVMMEKPLAVNLSEALAIAAVARQSGIQVIVNYETTWYPANQNAYAIVHDQHAIGDLVKIVAHAGHRGPKEIGCSPAFLEWLTDPVLNGGGALTDFGCYGADLATWFMDGQRPTAVLAITQQFKPEVYPKVEDEATVILAYPHAQAIIQASWNWPFDRKDLELYGRSGYVLAPQKDLLRVRKGGAEESELKLFAPPAPGPFTDEISYFAAVVRGDLQPVGLSSLDFNLAVTEILDAARQSAQTGKQVSLPPNPCW